jgi:protein-disulfide isomerase
VTATASIRSGSVEPRDLVEQWPRAGTGAPPVRIPDHTTAEGNGIALGRGPVTVHVYVDFSSPSCRAFELSAGDALRTMARDGLLTLVVHPVDLPDGPSTDHYSARAASAAGCAADAGRFFEFASLVLERQPPPGSPGLTDEQLVELGVEVGLSHRGFAQNVVDHRYVAWAGRGTRRALARGIVATPAVLVQGVPVPATGDAVTAAVRAAGR